MAAAVFLQFFFSFLSKFGHSQILSLHTPTQYPVVPPPTTQSFYKARSHLTISVTLNLIYPKKTYHDNARKYENVYFDARTKKSVSVDYFSQMFEETRIYKSPLKMYWILK